MQKSVPRQNTDFNRKPMKLQWKKDMKWYTLHYFHSNLYNQLDDVIKRAEYNQVKYFLTICTTLESFGMIKLIAKYMPNGCYKNWDIKQWKIGIRYRGYLLKKIMEEEC